MQESNNYSNPVDGITTAEKAALEKSRRLLAIYKEREKREGFITVRVDNHTVKLIKRSKAIKLGLIKE